MHEPVLMLGADSLKNAWTPLEAMELDEDITAMDHAEMMIMGSDHLVLAAHDRTPVERLEAAVINGKPQKKQRRKKK